MSTETLSCDYLIVGAGAMGLAFADELHAQRPHDEIILVDERAKPGGHWNNAYRFVSLHQPAAFYGVNSRSLGPGGAALATGSEILTYFEKVLASLLRTGKVRHLSQSHYTDSGEVVSLLSPNQKRRIEVRKKTVDAGYMKVQVPSTTPPKYDVGEGVRLIPPNGLPEIQSPVSQFVVVGAGKTGMDAVLFLLEQGVDPSAITWVVSNDAWLLDRDTLTPGRTLGWFVGQLELMAGATSLEEIFLRTEKAKSFMRVDEEVWPTKFRCATVNRSELAALRRIEDVVRLGRVRSLEPGRMVLDGGELETDAKALFVDCTADGLAKRPSVPIFGGSTLTLQPVFMCQQVFSAAFLAYVETRFDDDDHKNSLCRPVPHPEFPIDYLRAMADSTRNFESWSALLRWLRRSRLALPHHEPLPKLLLNTFRARRISPQALATIDDLLADPAAAAN